MEEELAKKFCAAFISQQMGIGMDYAYKTYVLPHGPMPINSSWIILARQAITNNRTLTDYLFGGFSGETGKPS